MTRSVLATNTVRNPALLIYQVICYRYNIYEMPVTAKAPSPPWLLLVFSLPSQRQSPAEDARSRCGCHILDLRRGVVDFFHSPFYPKPCGTNISKGIISGLAVRVIG